jgi:hypothetical protein
MSSSGSVDVQRIFCRAACLCDACLQSLFVHLRATTSLVVPAACFVTCSTPWRNTIEEAINDAEVVKQQARQRILEQQHLAAARKANPTMSFGSNPGAACSSSCVPQHMHGESHGSLIATPQMLLKLAAPQHCQR